MEAVKTKYKKESALLTSRQTVYFWHPTIKTKIKNSCLVSLDWISISGKFYVGFWTEKLKELGWIEDKTKVIDGHSNLFNMLNSEQNQIAKLIRNKHQRHSWRIETSNHLTPQEKRNIRETVKLFNEPHTTRIDIAFDFVNWKNAGTAYRLYPPTKMAQRIYGTTLYCGSNGSRKQYRYYDKLKERKSRNSIPLDNLTNWHRLELTVRRDLTENWQKEAKIMLDSFKEPILLSALQAGKLKFQEYCILKELSKHPENIQYLSKRSKAKYRKKIKENVGFNNEYAQSALKVLEEQAQTLEREIQSFLNK